MNKINFEYDEYFYQKIDLKENMNYKMEIFLNFMEKMMKKSNVLIT